MMAARTAAQTADQKVERQAVRKDYLTADQMVDTKVAMKADRLDWTLAAQTAALMAAKMVVQWADMKAASRAQQKGRQRVEGRADL